MCSVTIDLETHTHTHTLCKVCVCMRSSFEHVELSLWDRASMNCVTWVGYIFPPISPEANRGRGRSPLPPSLSRQKCAVGCVAALQVCACKITWLQEHNTRRRTIVGRGRTNKKASHLLPPQGHWRVEREGASKRFPLHRIFSSASSCMFGTRCACVRACVCALLPSHTEKTPIWQRALGSNSTFFGVKVSTKLVSTK